MRLLPLLLLIALAASCGPSKGQVKLTEPVDREGQWDRVLQEHTRRNQHYDWSTLEADLRVTLVTPRLRSAFIQDRSRFHGEIADRFDDELMNLGAPPDEGMDAPILSRPQAEEQVLIFMTIFVRDSKHRDLDADSSIWDIKLKRGDVEVGPLAIDSVRFSPGLVDIMPQVDRYDESYILRFPLVTQGGQPMLSPGGEPLRLLVASALGDLQAEWTLVGDGDAMTAVPVAPLPRKAPPPTKAATPPDADAGAEPEPTDAMEATDSSAR